MTEQTNGVQTLIFDRSNPNEIVCITPKNHPENKTGKAIQWTRKEELERRNIHRCDIAMVNISYANGTREQLCCYPNKDGTVDWCNIQKYFTKREQEEIERIARHIYENSKLWPAFAKLLNKF